MLRLQTYIELHPRDTRLLLAQNIDLIPANPELRDLVFDLMLAHAQINQRANEHVTADATENIEVKCFHLLLILILLIILISYWGLGD